MTQLELLEAVRAKLPERAAITPSWITQRYHVLEAQAIKVIHDLQAEGLLGKERSPRLGGFPVLVRR